MKKKIVYIGNNLQKKNPTTQTLLFKILTNLGNKVKLYSDKENKFLRLLNMCFGVIKNKKHTNYILIDTYSTLNFYFALIISQLSRLFSIKYIPILHGGNLKNRLANNPLFCKLIFSNSYCNVSPSKYFMKIFQEFNYKCNYIPNAIELANYNFLERKSLNYNLLWVRAFDKIYNPNMAILVLEALVKRGNKAKLCMIGPDKDGSLAEVINLAKEKNVFQYLEITGKLTKSEWINKSKNYDIFINTTTIDNVPVSVIEAMALGLPVISTNVGGIPYMIENDVNGILVEDNNKLEMVVAIEKLINNYILATKISISARKYVENFDIEKVQRQWSKLLN